MSEADRARIVWERLRRAQRALKDADILMREIADSLGRLEYNFNLDHAVASNHTSLIHIAQARSQFAEIAGLPDLIPVGRYTE